MFISKSYSLDHLSQARDQKSIIHTLVNNHKSQFDLSIQCIEIIIPICMYTFGIKFQQSRLDNSIHLPMYKSEFDGLNLHT